MAQSNGLKKLYPEIISADGLSNALDHAFVQINSSFVTSVIKNAKNFPLFFAHVRNENKLSQIYIAAEHKSYLSDYWRDGVCLANGATNDITTLARTIDSWLNQDISIIKLAEKYPNVRLSEKAEAFEKGNEVMYAWNDIQKSNWIPELNEFIELAINDEVLNKLFPFTSLYTLCFSRCTGYPYYTEDLPNITPKKYSNFCIPGYRSLSDSVTDNILVVSKNKTEPLGEGNAKEAMRIIRDNLPANIKPAVKGTADNKPI